MNIASYIFDNAKQRNIDKTALIYRSKSMKEKRVTYSELDKMSNKAANMIVSYGVKPGDRVFIYLERIPELYYFVLGILKCGAIYCPLFSSFGSEAVRHRLDDCKGGLIITQKHLAENISDIKSIIIDDDSFINSFESQSDEFIIFESSDDDIAIIHYTSGTTSKPKGVMHCHKAVASHNSSAREIFGLNESDIYWCTADPAWVTGSSYGIFAPLSVCATVVVCDPGLRLIQIFAVLEQYKINIWYTAPTLLRMIMREDPDKIKKFDFSSLKKAFSIGEALNPNIIEWFESNVGLPIYDTWFQTETGSIMIANWGEFPVKPGSMGKPIPGITSEILDEQYNPALDGTVGHLALKPAWPSMFKGYWNNEEKYRDSFKNGWYITGDLAKRDKQGYYWFQSREDDVINTAGHLVSPFEIESVMMTHPSIAEAAIVGIPDKLMAEVAKAVVVLKDGYEPSSELQLQYKTLVRNKLTPYAVPQVIQFVEELPKTTSGKIIRKMLRNN